MQLNPILKMELQTALISFKRNCLALRRTLLIKAMIIFLKDIVFLMEADALVDLEIFQEILVQVARYKWLNYFLQVQTISISLKLKVVFLKQNQVRQVLVKQFLEIVLLEKMILLQTQ